LLLTIIIIFII